MRRTIIFQHTLQYAGILVLGIMISCSGKKTSKTEMETASEWISLFDGETLNGWKRYNAKEIGPLWIVEDGSIKCEGTGHGESSGEFGGSLMTLETYGNFELEIEWKISAKGNSGIIYHVVENQKYSHAHATGPEYQVADDPPVTGDRSKDNKKTGANYDMYAAPATKKLKPVMQWNTSKIVYKDGKVEHWLNREKVVEFDENSNDFTERYNKSKWSSGDYPDWNTFKEGSIALQNHGAAVWYRNIRIRRL